MRNYCEAAPRSGNERLDEILAENCDRNCRHPRRMLKDVELEWHCEHCPMVKLIDYVDELRGKDGC